MLEIFLDRSVFYEMHTVHIDGKSAIFIVPEEFVEVTCFIVETAWDFSHKTPELTIGFIEDSQFALFGGWIKSCQLKVQQDIGLIIILFISLQSCREILVSTI